MADIRDSFIGNLRSGGSAKNGNTSGDNFIDIFRKSMNERLQQGGYRNQPMQEPKTQEQVADAAAGTRFHRLSDEQAQTWQNSKYEPVKITALPQTEKDWKAFTDGLDDFRVVMNSYSNEPNQDARIKIIEQSAPRFQSSEKLSRYLAALHANELANKRGELTDFNYKDQPSYLEDSINEVLSYRFKRA